MEMKIEATVEVDDVTALASWVVDHLPDNSEYYVITDWVDPDRADDDDGDEPEDVIAGEIAIYPMTSAWDMFDARRRAAPGGPPTG